MDIADTWAVRYYEWSLQQAREEFEAGFPLLALVQGRIAFAMIEYANLLDARDRMQLATALVKRLNTRALAIEGKSLNSAESNLLEDFLNRDKRADPRGPSGVPLFASKKQQHLTEKIDSGVVSRGDRTAVRKLVTRELGSVIGSSVSKPSGAVKYEIPTPGWRMKTTIDYGGSHGQITYAHVIVPSDGRPLFPPIHLCGWLGIAGQTSWDLYTSEQEEEVAAGIVRVVSWFAARWDALTRNLQ